MSELYKWNKSGMRMIIESGFKEFDKQTNLITSGNCISNTQYSNYIRPYNETKCNGFEKQKGDLFNFDLQHFSISNSLREYIKSLNDQVCLYEFRIYRKGIKDVIGWLIERKNGQITIEVNNYNMGHYLKRYKALEFCKNIIEEKRF